MSPSLPTKALRFGTPRASSEPYRFNWRALFSTIVVVITYLSQTSPVSAQTTSIAIWPPLLEATIQPGKSVTQVYRLKNLGDDTIITAYLKPFSPSGELGHVQLQLQGQSLTGDPANGRVGTAKPEGLSLLNSALSFFSLLNADLKTLPATFPLKAGQTQELVLKIKIPEDSKLTDHYFTFLFDSNTTGLVGDSGTTTQATIGSNILLTISDDGQPKLSAKIEEFAAGQIKVRPFLGASLLRGIYPKRSEGGSDLNGDLRFVTLNLLDSFSPISFLIRVKNTGTTRLKTIGQIELKNTFNNPVATLPLREDNILSNSIRKLQTTTDWKPFFPLGRFTATASITPQDSTNTITQTIYFFVLPYKAILVVVLIFLGFKALTKSREQQ
jgi:hypothetical protein